MDFITSVIASALGSLSFETVKHGYTKIKEVLGRRYGADSKVYKALQELEDDRESAGRRAVLAEELVKVHDDAELRQAIEALVEALQKSGQTLAKPQVDARGSKIGIMGDYAHVTTVNA
mgnify:CR=1 FL=1